MGAEDVNDYLSRHAKFDDQCYWRFERTSRLPIGYFPRESWWTKFAHRLVFWLPFLGLVCALVFQW